MTEDLVKKGVVFDAWPSACPYSPPCMVP